MFRRGLVEGSVVKRAKTPGLWVKGMIEGGDESIKHLGTALSRHSNINFTLVVNKLKICDSTGTQSPDCPLCLVFVSSSPHFFIINVKF